MVLGPDGALRIALVTDSLSAIGADLLSRLVWSEDRAGYRRVLASLNGTGHPDTAEPRLGCALGTRCEIQQRPVGLMIGNLDGICGAAAEAYLIGTSRLPSNGCSTCGCFHGQ